MLESIVPAPADPILGLTEAYAADPNPNKINLGVGVYKDAAGSTPILAAVKQAEQRILSAETTKGYLGIGGMSNFAEHVQQLLFAETSGILGSQRATTFQTPGGTGALRVVANFLQAHFPSSKVWLTRPTWPNHPNIFQAAGLELDQLPYFDSETQSLCLDALLSKLADVAAGDVVVLHGCCHNPSGVDPTPEEWRSIAAAVAERGAMPLVDFAYQGFGEGLDADTIGLKTIAEHCPELIVCSSFSKNFGLYRERVGGLTVVAQDQTARDSTESQLKAGVRANYSNPPAHGAAVVCAILEDAELRRQWESELATMRERIRGMRQLFVDTLASEGVAADFSFLKRQRGMFSFSGLSPEQVATLREQHSIYIVNSGRVNFAGMTPGNVPTLCAAIAETLSKS